MGASLRGQFSAIISKSETNHYVISDGPAKDGPTRREGSALTYLSTLFPTRHVTDDYNECISGSKLKLGLRYDATMVN